MRSSLENHTWFQTKIGNVYLFSDQIDTKTLPNGATHTYIAYVYIICLSSEQTRTVKDYFK